MWNLKSFPIAKKIATRVKRPPADGDFANYTKKGSLSSTGSQPS